MKDRKLFVLAFFLICFTFGKAQELRIYNFDTLYPSNYKTFKDTVFEVGDHIQCPDILFSFDDLFQNNDSLEKIADFMFDHPYLVFDYVFHSDIRGSAEYNIELTNKRAEDSYWKLKKYFNIDTSQIASCSGKGEDEPILDEKFINSLDNRDMKEQAFAVNRRNELVVVKIRFVLPVCFKTLLFKLFLY